MFKSTSLFHVNEKNFSKRWWLTCHLNINERAEIKRPILFVLSFHRLIILLFYHFIILSSYYLIISTFYRHIYFSHRFLNKTVAFNQNQWANDRNQSRVVKNNDEKKIVIEKARVFSSCFRVVAGGREGKRFFSISHPACGKGKDFSQFPFPHEKKRIFYLWKTGKITHFVWEGKFFLSISLPAWGKGRDFFQFPFPHVGREKIVFPFPFPTVILSCLN